MTDYFNNIIPDYRNAEITCLFLNDRDAKKNYNLLTLIELVPEEQESSLLLGKEENHYLEMLSTGPKHNVFLTRTINLPVEEAITIFENAENGYNLEYLDKLKAPISFLDATVLDREPSGAFPLLISKGRERTIGTLLPHRNTGFRVWGKLDRKKKLFNKLDKKLQDRINRKASELTGKHLNFDISAFQEHLGNVYLFACNPYLRGYELKLLDYNRELFINFHERLGKSIVGCKLILQDKRGENFAFYREIEITGTKMRISLPEFPDQLYTTIFDPHGYPLSISQGVWTNFAVDLSLQETTLNIEKPSGGFISVQKNSSAGVSNIGTYDHSVARYLGDHLRLRKMAESRKNKEFAFFPGSEQDKEEASIYISEIIAQSSKRCILLDPYFSENALFYAYLTSSISIPIKILGASFYLRKKASEEADMVPTHAELLQLQLLHFRKKFPNQAVECRVLKGRSGSQLHDRYIISDDEVYLLGSSFHEFGGRATTIFKVPAPIEMISKAYEWLGDEHSVDLDTFVERIKNKTDDTTED